MGPAPWIVNYDPWRTNVNSYRCPSDPYVPTAGKFGANNYAVCIGDGIPWTDRGGVDDNSDNVNTAADMHLRGMFKTRRVTGFRDTLDGLSNTAMAGEIVCNAGRREINAQPVFIDNGDNHFNPTHAKCTTLAIDPARPRFYLPAANLRYGMADEWEKGHRWMCGLPMYTGFNTVRPPNRESCQSHDNDGREGTYTAGSRHQGGCHILMGDGAVKFITDSIEAGNQTVGISVAGMESPYGLWGALGTSESGETKQLE
jgi:prepilin-type processing-associated H-X9-DG protein